MSLFGGGSKDSDSSGKGDGERWSEGGHTYTANSADDKKAEGGYYLSVQDDETGDHSTAVYNSDNSLADTKANKDLK